LGILIARNGWGAISKEHAGSYQVTGRYPRRSSRRLEGDREEKREDTLEIFWNIGERGEGRRRSEAQGASLIPWLNDS